MATDIDSLQIQINAQATKANDALDRLTIKLDRLTTSLSKVDGSKLNGLSSGIRQLGTAMQVMGNVKTTDFTRLSSNLAKLGSVNVSALNSAASSMANLTAAFNGLGTVSANATAVGDLAKNIEKLGSKNVQTAVDNIPRLATAMRSLMNELSKAPKVSQNLIDMTNALANLTAQGEKVGSASGSIVKGLSNTDTATKKSKKSFKSLASAIGTFYANFGLVIRGVKDLYGSIEGTADYLESFNYFEVALNKVGGDWVGDWEKYSKKLGVTSAEEYASSFKTRLNESLKGLSGVQISVDVDGKMGLLTDTGMKNLGLNIKEVTQYASQLASVTNSVGQTGEVTLATASAFTKLGADMSSLFNVDYSSVMNNLQSGLIGQSRALYKYGIDITNATLQTYAYGLGVEKAVSEMTQAEKMQLRMIAILDQSRVSWGDASNTINSLSNQIRQFKNNIKEAGMILGQLFVPIINKIMPIVNGLAIAIKRLMQSIASIFGIKINLEDFGQGSNGAADSMDGFSDSMDDAAEAAKKLKKATTTLGIDELNINSPQEDTSGGTSGGVGGGIDLTDEILKATEEYEKAWQEAYDRMQNKAEEFADRITKALEPVLKIIEDFAVGDFFQAGQDVSNLVVSITDFFARAIDNVDWYGIGTKIGDFFAGIDWIKVFKSVGNLVWQGLKATFEMAIGSFNSAPLETAILGLLTLPAIVGFGSNIIKFIAKSFKNVLTLIEPLITPFSAKITEMFSLWTGGAGTFGESFMAVFGTGGIVAVALAGLAICLGVAYVKNEEIRESFANATQAIKDGFQPAVEFITSTLLPDLQAGWERLKEILSPFTTFLSNTFVSIWQNMINPALVYIGKTVLPLVASTFENLWNNVLVPFGSFLADVLEPAIQIISDVLSILWENVVVPLADAVGNILGKAFEGLSDVLNRLVVPIVNAAIKVFQFLWKNVFFPIVDFLQKTFKPVFENVFKVISGLIDSLGTTLGGLIDFVVGVFTLNWGKAWNGVKDIFRGVFNGLITITEGAINHIINGINVFISGFNGIATKIGAVIGLNISLPSIPTISLPRFEMGGFPPSYSLFMAGENGIPEIAGTVGGKTAVAGGAEITGIKDAVLQSSDEETRLLREQNELLRMILEKDMSVNIGDREIYKASVRGGSAYGKLLVT